MVRVSYSAFFWDSSTMADLFTAFALLDLAGSELSSLLDLLT